MYKTSIFVKMLVAAVIDQAFVSRLRPQLASLKNKIEEC